MIIMKNSFHLLILLAMPLIAAAEVPYTVSPGTTPDEYAFRIYTHGTSGVEADDIAYEVFKQFLHQNNYSYYNVIKRPFSYKSPYSNYVVRFYRDIEISY